MQTAIYARQSVDKKDSISIETQIELCQKEASHPVKIYEDKGFSGKNTNRPSFTSLISDIEGGLIKEVVVYRLDRISRSITDFANIISILEQHNVSFVSVTEKFDTSTPVGKAMLYIIMIFAQLERETIAERIKDNYYARGKTGSFLGGPPPLGFAKSTETINGKNVPILTPTTDMPIIERLYDLYATTNRSLGDIARQFQEEYGNAYGVWNNIKLSRLLQNPAYVKADANIYSYYKSRKCVIANPIEHFTGEYGCFLYGKRDRNLNKYRNIEENVLSIALHKGAIDSNIFLRCQAKLIQNKQIKNSGKGKHTWLTGLIKCGTCGYSLPVKVTNNKKDNYKYFYCSGKSANKCDTGVPNTDIEEIESFVQSEIIRFLTENDTVKFEVDQSNNAHSIELIKIEEQISDLVEKIPKATDSVMRYINEKIEELETERERLKLLEITEQTRNLVKLPSAQSFIDGNAEQRKDIMKILIEKILLSADSVNIIWR